MFKRLMSPPVFAGNEDKTRTAILLQQILLACALLPVFGAVVIVLNPPVIPFVLPPVTFLTVMLVVLFVLNKRGYETLASVILVGVLILAFTAINFNGGGEPRPLLLLIVTTIMISGLLLGARAPIVVAVILILQQAAIVILNVNGVISPPDLVTTPAQNILGTGLGYILIAFLLRLAITRIQFVVNQLRQSQKGLQESNRDLQDLSASLERRVEERTHELAARSKDLEAANAQIQRRAAQFEALAQVAQSVANIRDLQELLPEVANVISKNYGFYHVGIFFLDDAREFAVLIASNSEGGQRMLERKHHLRVGEEGIVGAVTATGKPRIALDVGKDAVYFGNPDLPNTHSEMALPLMRGNQIIGALDVQSAETGAFSDEDVKSLSLLANQVSLAIENARLFEESNTALSELQTISRLSTREAWKGLPERQNLLGYKYSMTGSSPLQELIQPVENDMSGNDERKDSGSYVVPIELRGEVIGSLVIQSVAERSWSQDEKDLIKAVAERVALSAENARLFEETAQRAERERLVSEITGKIRSHTNPKSMIETAMQELQSALGASRVRVISNSSREGKAMEMKPEEL